VGEADVSGLEGGDTGREAMDLLPGGHRPGGGMPGHVAVMPDPVDGGDRPLGVVLIGGREDGRLGGEAQLQQIDAVAEPDQVIPSSAGVSSKVSPRRSPGWPGEARRAGSPRPRHHTFLQYRTYVCGPAECRIESGHNAVGSALQAGKRAVFSGERSTSRERSATIAFNDERASPVFENSAARLWRRTTSRCSLRRRLP